MSDLTSTQRNAINLQMRQQPWYQNWFAQRRLNPNQVNLGDSERQDLANVAAQNGFALPSGALIDQAGNVNVQHGFASLPTWAKVAIGAAPVALGGYLAAPALFGSGAGANAAVAAGGDAAAGGGGAAAGGLTIGQILAGVAPSAIGAVTGIYGARTQANAARDASNASTTAANYAADLQAKANADALAFAKEQEATRQAEFNKTQALNLDQYNQAMARLAPYRAMGQGAIGQLMQRPTGGTVGDLMVRRG